MHNEAVQPVHPPQLLFVSPIVDPSFCSAVLIPAVDPAEVSKLHSNDPDLISFSLKHNKEVKFTE